MGVVMMAPANMDRQLQLRDGRAVFVRRVEAADAPAIAGLCERLSPASSLARFYTPDRRLSEHEARALAQPDHVRTETLVAQDGDRVVALGSLHQLGNEPHAELTLLVEDAYQGQGLGRQMLDALLSTASELGFSLLWMEILPDNTRVLRLLETAGLEMFADPYFGLTRVLVYL